MSSQFENAGIDDIMTDEPQYIWTVPIFFLVIGFVLRRVVVLPAIDQGSVSSAFVNGRALAGSLEDRISLLQEGPPSLGLVRGALARPDGRSLGVEGGLEVIVDGR